MKKNHSHIRQCRSDFVFSVFDYIVVILFSIIVVYPVYFVIIASISDPSYVNSGALLIYPKGIDLRAYNSVFSDNRIFIGYSNTIIFTVTGTLLGLSVCLPAGYSLSRSDLPGRNFLMAIMVFTMYFSGGMIPLYLVNRTLNLTNTRTVIILLGSVSVYNIILIRTFFINSLPVELREAAFIDGCGNVRFFFTIALPLAKAIIAVIGLYLAVGYWNSYFSAMIYLSDSKKWPLQLYLREILMVNQSEQYNTSDPESAAEAAQLVQVVKYGIIVISAVPIICLYPFLQKYFIKGVMIGSIKG